MPELEGAPDDFYFDVCLVHIDGFYAFLDKDFKKLTKQEFESLGEMTKDGLANFRIKDETLEGYCDKEGNVVIKAQWNECGTFADGIAVVREDHDNGTSTYYVIDKNGKVLYEQKDPMYNLGEGRILFRKDNGKCGMLDKNGNEILGATYGYIYPFTEGLAMVQHATNGKFGFIDTKGNEVIETQYADGLYCYEGVIWVQRYSNTGDGKWILIDKKGNEKFELMKNQSPASNYHNGLSLVRGESKYFYLDTKGEEKYSWKVSGRGFAPEKKAMMRGTKYAPLMEEL
jgi:hypothetical protein